jgi:hypothetical protein
MGYIKAMISLKDNYTEYKGFETKRYLVTGNKYQSSTRPVLMICRLLQQNSL